MAKRLASALYILVCEGRCRALEACAASSSIVTSPSLVTLEASQWGRPNNATHVFDGGAWILIFHFLLLLSFFSPSTPILFKIARGPAILFLCQTWSLFFYYYLFCFGFFFNWFFSISSLIIRLIENCTLWFFVFSFYM
jgi:hypothetical protein